MIFLLLDLNASSDGKFTTYNGAFVSQGVCDLTLEQTVESCQLTCSSPLDTSILAPSNIFWKHVSLLWLKSFSGSHSS